MSRSRSIVIAIGCGLMAVVGFASEAVAATSVPVVQSGDTAPSTGGTFVGFGPVAINDLGTLAFDGTVSVAGGSGLWRMSGGILEQVFALGTSVSVPTGATFQSIAALSLPQSDDPIIVRGTLSSFDDALYSASSVDGLLPLAVEGQAAAGTDGVFQILLASLRVSDAGEVAFFGTLTGGSTNADNATGIWSGPGGALSLLARQGDAAPGGSGET